MSTTNRTILWATMLFGLSVVGGGHVSADTFGVDWSGSGIDMVVDPHRTYRLIDEDFYDGSWADQQFSGFPFGRHDFEEAGFSAAIGNRFSLTFSFAANKNDATEQWGLWFNDGVGSEARIMADPLHLLDRAGAWGWVDQRFSLNKEFIVTALSENSSDWFFVLREITASTGNTIKIDQVQLTAKTVATPIPGALWLLAPGFIALAALRGRIPK